MIRRVLKLLGVCALVLIVLPVASYAGWSYARGWPASWRTADWSSSGLLPPPGADDRAAVYVLAARSGRWKGIFAVHHWIVVKRAGAASYDRYEVVGWGTPVRHNAYVADGRWYSGEPYVVARAHGPAATRAIPGIEAAVAGYPWGRRGDYSVWPGPNSNTFVAHVARAAPELRIELDAAGVGKDWLGPGLVADRLPSGTGWQVSYAGIVGAGLGWREGLELHLLGATIGLDPESLSIKLPGIGRIGLGGISSRPS